MFEETHYPSTLYNVSDNVFPQTGGSWLDAIKGVLDGSLFWGTKIGRP
jgi:hypothetical protein